MAKRLVRAIGNRRGGNLVNKTITYSKNEPYAICFYLYKLFEEMSNHEIYSRNEEAIVLFIRNVELLGKTERLDAVFEAEIKNLKKQKLLKKFSKALPEEMCFCSTDIPFLYEQDKRVDSIMSDFEIINERTINLVRILVASKKPVFSSIINAVVFCSKEDFSLPKQLNLTQKQINAVYDISLVKFLVHAVSLSEYEARYLLLQCRLYTNSDLKYLMNRNDEISGNILPELLGVSKKTFTYMLRSDQKLKTYGFIDEDGDYNSSLNECIEVQSIDPYFSDLLKVCDCEKCFDLNSFSIKEESKEICKDLLCGKNPLSLLFYGKPGSGKTELAKSLCRETGKKVFIFKNEVEADRDINVLSRLVCLLSMDRQDSVLIVDEADTLIKTLDFSFFGVVPSVNKGVVNKMLENNRNKVIFIINHQHQIDESTLRRFTFSIKFEAMPVSQLHSIAKAKMNTLDLSENTKLQIVDLFDKYHLTGQSVDNIVKTIEGMENKDEEVVLRKADIVMKENSLLLTGRKKMRDSVKKEYDPSVLNASMNPLQIVEMVENAQKFAERIKGSESGIRMLFYGLSGTGKTELARYIAEKLGKEILLKRASDIFGMFVGENEKNIRDAFSQAEANDSILLFDEADSFFADRNKARTQWERTSVNEFLTQMEEFSGILICITNLRNIMDPAMQRRFHMMVEFKPMKFDGIKKMSEKYFPDWHLSNAQLEKLEDSESVTPGDFGTLAGRIRFMNPDSITSDYIMEELLKLQSEKTNEWNGEYASEKKTIGFSV